MERNIVIQGLDLIDVVNYISKKNKKFQAIILSDLEGVLDKDSTEYMLVRKLILDVLNNYTRSIVRTIFGDVEYLVK